MNHVPETEKERKLREIWPEIAKMTGYQARLNAWLDANRAMNVATQKWQARRQAFIDRGELLAPLYFKSKDEETAALRRLHKASEERLAELLELEETIKAHLEKHGAL